MLLTGFDTLYIFSQNIASFVTLSFTLTLSVKLVKLLFIQVFSRWMFFYCNNAPKYILKSLILSFGSECNHKVMVHLFDS